MSVFEITMLVCFGASWPLNIYKSAKTRTAKGKSVIFAFAVFVGYIFGFLHKVYYSPDVVMYLYLLNLLLVSTDICLTFRNRALDRQRDSAAAVR